jgi:hypothetical protein
MLRRKPLHDAARLEQLGNFGPKVRGPELECLSRYLSN